MNAAIPDREMIVLCTFPMELRQAAGIRDVASAHQIAVLKRHGSWEMKASREIARAKTEIHHLIRK